MKWIMGNIFLNVSLCAGYSHNLKHNQAQRSVVRKLLYMLIPVPLHRANEAYILLLFGYLSA
jgi:hypothetical protein